MALGQDMNAKEEITGICIYEGCWGRADHFTAALPVPLDHPHRLTGDQPWAILRGAAGAADRHFDFVTEQELMDELNKSLYIQVQFCKHPDSAEDIKMIRAKLDALLPAADEETTLGMEPPMDPPSNSDGGGGGGSSDHDAPCDSSGDDEGPATQTAPGCGGQSERSSSGHAQ